MVFVPKHSHINKEHINFIFVTESLFKIRVALLQFEANTPISSVRKPLKKRMIINRKTKLFVCDMDPNADIVSFYTLIWEPLLPECSLSSSKLSLKRC